MKLTKESMEAAMRQQGMAKVFFKGFLFTLLSTFGLAALIAAHGSWIGNTVRPSARSSACSAPACAC